MAPDPSSEPDRIAFDDDDLSYAALTARWWDDPSNTCFGCSTSNPRALGLRFALVDGVPPDDGGAPLGPAVEAPYVVDELYNGAPGVVHGGVQAAMLDEAMGHALHALETGRYMVTVELTLRYRRPMPTATPLRVRAWVTGLDGDDAGVAGEIVGPDGTVLTRGVARFRMLGPLSDLRPEG